MNYALRYFFVLIWIAYLICSGLYLFSKGFLLSRIVTKNRNACEHFLGNLNEVSHYLKFKKKYGQIFIYC